MRHSKLGFSLVELMVVIGIMGILAGIAVPRYQSYQAKAKKMEAINMLNQIYTLQQVYFSENSVYATTALAVGRTGTSTSVCTFDTANSWVQQIGFVITPCDTKDTSKMPLFQYNIAANGTNGFIVTATDTTKSAKKYSTANDKACTITIDETKTLTDTCK